MEIIPIIDEEDKILDVSYSIKDDYCIIRWKWPNHIDYVSVLKKAEGQVLDPIKNGKLYTKEEYKSHNGYLEKIEEIGKFEYTIYPYMIDYGERTIGEQEGGENRIVLITGKVNTYYSISEKSRWFSNKKNVQISIRAEQHLSKDLFCYVKKKGSYPLDKEDGIMFQFIHDFKPGKNKFAEIEVDKDEFIKLFLTDREKFGEIHSLIRE